MTQARYVKKMKSGAVENTERQTLFLSISVIIFAKARKSITYKDFILLNVH